VSQAGIVSKRLQIGSRKTNVRASSSSDGDMTCASVLQVHGDTSYGSGNASECKVTNADIRVDNFTQMWYAADKRSYRALSTSRAGSQNSEKHTDGNSS